MSERETAGNRRLSRYQGDPGSNPGAEDVDGPDRRDVLDEADDDDRPTHLRADEEDTGAVDGAGETCAECDRTAAFNDPAEALGNPNLPSVPLCRPHILEHT